MDHRDPLQWRKVNSRLSKRGSDQELRVGQTLAESLGDWREQHSNQPQYHALDALRLPTLVSIGPGEMQLNLMP